MQRCEIVVDLLANQKVFTKAFFVGMMPLYIEKQVKCRLMCFIFINDPVQFLFLYLQLFSFYDNYCWKINDVLQNLRLCCQHKGENWGPGPPS